MHARKIAAILAAVIFSLIGLTSPANAVNGLRHTAAANTSATTATFRGGSGNYLTQPPGTDGLRTVTGTETFTNSKAGTLSVTGTVSGLAASTSYVTVPYTDPYCTPLPGVTAYPSGPFTTDATGKASFTASVNPKAINPAASLVVGQVRSVSIRQLIVGSPIPGVPNIPNVGAVETCDRNPART